MRTVICHFYNEEYLLPWWLDHHREIFDYGVLIDNGSTDRSMEICRDLAPDWRLVRGRNHMFGAILQDFEVMQYESELPGWKIVLNITEFLHGPQLHQLEKELLDADFHGAMIDALIMVDPFPDTAPEHGKSLIRQKYHGYRESDVIPKFDWANRRARLYHRMPIGAYHVGRHGSQWPRVGGSKDYANILWYGFSPWCPETLQRKLQIKETIPESDRKIAFGHQHLASSNELEQRRQMMLEHVKDLSEVLFPPSLPANTSSR